MKKTAHYIIVDAHVHIHAHFDLDRLFLISLQNFRKSLHQFQIFDSFESFLLLTESAGVNGFKSLAAMADKEIPGNEFIVRKTAESCSLKIITNGGQNLFVVSGKQIVTSENLEVLALGLTQEYPDGRPLHDVLEDLEGTGCLRTLPWGAGKWLGNRGKIINALIASWESGSIFLGDNGNRPAFWPLPKVFQKGHAKEIYNLPGSDPLPFPEAEKKAGSYGFMLRGQINSEAPFESLKSAVRSTPQTILPYGTRESFVPFVKNQFKMQFFKKRR